MTEAEAKQTWCPLVAVANGIFVNAMVKVGLPTKDEKDKLMSGKCRGSECMFWRANYLNGNAGDRGHCGLAGDE